MNRFAKRKRGVLLGFGAATAFLTLTSTAFACTVYKGNATVTDVNNGVTSTASVEGDADADHSFCGPGGDTLLQALQPVYITLPFTVTVAVGSAACGGSKAPAADYTMNWATRKTDVPQPEVPGGLCNDAENDKVGLGTITVDSLGSGGTADNANAAGGVLGTPPSLGPATICFLKDGGTVADPTPPEVRLLVI